MEEELVSGPDLGAGFLYQLTRLRSGPSARFTYHAQEGGADASGPPIGSPEPFGWKRAIGMCQFGGRECWHRAFDTDDRELAIVRAAYNRTRFVMEASLSQAYRELPVPWEAALEEWMDRAVPALEPTRTPWILAGAGASAIAGAPAPRVASVTIWTNDVGVRAVASAIPEYLVEPPALTDWEAGATFAARGFLGTLREGTRVEWGTPPGAPRARPIPPSRLVRWRQREIPVAGPE